MSDLISRQWLLDVFEHFVPWDTDKDRNRAIHHVRELAPSVPPERIRGWWNKISPAGIYECSVCGQNVMTNDIDAYHYCHGCGAEMREDSDG